MVKRLVTAGLYGAGAVIAALQVKIPTNKNEWGALVGVFAFAAWGKFSSEQTVVAANRPVWSVQERRAEQIRQIEAAEAADAKK